MLNDIAKGLLREVAELNDLPTGGGIRWMIASSNSGTPSPVLPLT